VLDAAARSLAELEVMIAVATVVGTARVVSAGGKILRPLGLAIAAPDSEMAGGGDAGQ
jgi:hypothetical protein